MKHSINALIATLFTVGLLQCLQFGVPNINFDFIANAKVVNTEEVILFYYKTNLDKIQKVEAWVTAPSLQMIAPNEQEVGLYLWFLTVMFVAYRKKKYHVGKRLHIEETLGHHYTSFKKNSL